MKSCPYSWELWKKVDLAFFCLVTYWLTCFHSGACKLGKKFAWATCQWMANITCAVLGNFVISLLQLVVHSVALQSFP